MDPLLVYYSSTSLNTHRFVMKTGLRALRIPVSPKDAMPEIDEPFVLICPTYAGENGEGAVPKQVIRFLNDESTRKQMRGVIASGNRNFGQYYGYAGKIIASKCNVPLLYKFELMGTPKDVTCVKTGVENLWKQKSQIKQQRPQPQVTR